MSIYLSYFSKNATLIEDNKTNNSQNPVTEISYGTINGLVSRFIFDIDLDPLKEKINQGEILQDNITKHTLKLKNTIRIREDLIGGKFADGIQQRTGSFELNLFNVDEEFDQGNGYEFIYNQEEFPLSVNQAPNWFERKTGVNWTYNGAFSGQTGSTTGTTEIIATQSFQKGNEDIEIDVTDYINSRLFSGQTGFTGTTYGLGLKFTNDVEAIVDNDNIRYAVAFHGKNTNTFFEPYIETTINDNINDDRNYFFLDKDNDLYLISRVNGILSDVTVNSVNIVDYQDNVSSTIPSNQVTKVKNGIYKITLNLPSSAHTDCVIYTDKWNIIQNGINKTIEQEFYLLNNENYFNFDNNTYINPKNYFFSVNGILENEKIVANTTRRILINIKQFEPNQNNNLSLEIKYRLYTKQNEFYQFNTIPITRVDRIKNNYEFTIDTSFLVPHDYYIDILLYNEGFEYNMKTIKFTVISNGISKT